MTGISETQQVLENVVQDTFATMVFLFPEDRDQPPPPPEACLTAVVGFSGPFRGEVRLAVGPDMPALVATNMLGLEPGSLPTSEQERDAMGELVNVICGNLLPAITSPLEVFNVHPPRVQAGECPGRYDVSARSEMWLDGGFVRVSLTLHSAPAPVGGPSCEGIET
jgi:hypothetical protein